MDCYINVFTVRYSDLDRYIRVVDDGKCRETFFFINLNYLFDRIEKFFEIKKDDEVWMMDSDIIVYNILNFIAHYRYYFFKHMKSNNNVIILVDESVFKFKKSLSLLKTMIEFFPKIRLITTKNIFFTKYHCMKEILYIFRNKNRNITWVDFDKENPLINLLTDKNYYRIRTVNMKTYVKSEDDLCSELNLPDIYKYDCKYYLPFISVCRPGKRLSEKLSEFIKTHSSESTSDRDKNLMFNNMYGKPEYVSEINDIFDMINSKEMQTIIKNIFKTWGHHIYDKKIMNFNEIVDTKNINVNVNKLMCTV